MKSTHRALVGEPTGLTVSVSVARSHSLSAHRRVCQLGVRDEHESIHFGREALSGESLLLLFFKRVAFKSINFHEVRLSEASLSSRVSFVLPLNDEAS